MLYPITLFSLFFLVLEAQLKKMRQKNRYRG